MTDLLLRPFEEADWPAVRAIIEEVAEQGETYCLAGHLDDAALRAFWLYDAHTVVAEMETAAGRQVLGSAHMGPNRAAQGEHIGTASFMVSAAARGHGLGRALGEYAVAWHRRAGFRGIQFNAVVETNTAAVRLWQALGFTVVGTVPGAFRRPTGEYVGLHVMFLDLTATDRPPAGDSLVP
ncbi:MAG TPA: GNAT family N-acetyltransferase [Marmoricola sp.]|nr:GNAT family N-acetyltransferase [Marmoricola sp.]